MAGCAEDSGGDSAEVGLDSSVAGCSSGDSDAEAYPAVGAGVSGPGAVGAGVLPPADAVPGVVPGERPVWELPWAPVMPGMSGLAPRRSPGLWVC